MACRLTARLSSLKRLSCRVCVIEADAADGVSCNASGECRVDGGLAAWGMCRSAQSLQLLSVVALATVPTSPWSAAIPGVALSASVTLGTLTLSRASSLGCTARRSRPEEKRENGKRRSKRVLWRDREGDGEQLRRLDGHDLFH